jgi:hypothetical protein
MMNIVTDVLVLITTVHIHARLSLNGKLSQNVAQSLCSVSYIFIDYSLMLYGAHSNCPASHHVFLSNHCEIEVTEYVCLQRTKC